MSGHDSVLVRPKAHVLLLDPLTLGGQTFEPYEKSQKLWSPAALPLTIQKKDMGFGTNRLE